MWLYQTRQTKHTHDNHHIHDFQSSKTSQVSSIKSWNSQIFSISRGSEMAGMSRQKVWSRLHLKWSPPKIGIPGKPAFLNGLKFLIFQCQFTQFQLLKSTHKNHFYVHLFSCLYKSFNTFYTLREHVITHRIHVCYIW